jgi:tRNA(Ile2) C34 agmatinyltransferase TiaS
MTEGLRCPSCRSVQVDATEDDHRCKVCGTTWRPTKRRTGAPDYVRALRHDRYAEREPGAFWSREG